MISSPGGAGSRIRYETSPVMRMKSVTAPNSQGAGSLRRASTATPPQSITTASSRFDWLVK